MTVLVVFLALACWARDAQAAPIAFAEPPELALNANTPTPVGTLDVGIKTVSGSIDCSGDQCSTEDHTDAFTLNLPASLEITSITLEISGFAAQNTDALIRDRDDYLPIAVFDFVNRNGQLSLFSGAAAGPGSLGLR